MPKINIPVPKLQIDFSFVLEQIRSTYLQDALGKTIDNIDLSTLNGQLEKYVPKDKVKALAKRGLRGELVFPVPCMLKANPFLLGYYRLLLGFSQKEFYTTKFGVSEFKLMETKGTLSSKNQNKLPDLCCSIVKSACALLEGIGIDRINNRLLDDLTLLTLGPQLRGGANVKKGIVAITAVFKSIHNIVAHAVFESTSGKIQIINAAERKVFIEFAPDPDIVIREEMKVGNVRNIIAIEVKGGTDFSNIHNRIGEAEKSHQKAKIDGYTECWTVVNVDRIDFDMARMESPSTNRFYRISSLQSEKGEEYEDFKNRILSCTGIKNRLD